MKTDKKHRNDIILICALLAAAGLAYAAVQLFKSEGGYAVVVRDGEEIASYPLSEDITVTIPSSNGGFNTLVISGGAADVTDADCPDRLCVNQHAIKYNGETIVCLPNKLTVKIVSSESGDVDFTV